LRFPLLGYSKPLAKEIKVPEVYMSQKIAYEKHPMPEGREAELRAAGFKILDIRFKPADAEPVQEKRKPGRPAKSDE
jgi:hypothetical protein